MFTSLIIADATREETQWLNELERRSASPETAIRLLRVIGDIDLTDLLPQLSVPVLLLHSRGDARVPFKHGIKLARLSRTRTFFLWKAENHLILSHKSAFPRFVDEMCSFLGEDGPHPLLPEAAEPSQPMTKESF